MSQLFKGQRVIRGYDVIDPSGFDEVVDAGEELLMPGVIDCHVHVNDPGRDSWEGFSTATKAAAAGGISTIVDMPLNSIPSTTSRDAFNVKLDAAKGQLHVDVGFWGGVVPGNEAELPGMIEMGICGFKCFMIHSGVDEFQWTNEADIRAALRVLKGTDSVLMFHAELDVPGLQTEPKGDRVEYKTFLDSRPDVMEVEAIDLVCRLCQEYQVPCHIVHLATADALPLIRKCKQQGAPLTVETTHHYLTLAAEDVPNGATQYKCCPPIRSQQNQDDLWGGVLSGDIDMVVSDHSPCTTDLKTQGSGDFIAAWGGISSVQFGLSLLWTNLKSRGMNIHDLHRLLTTNTAKLPGLSKLKGSIEAGKHADFVIWAPESTFKITEDIIQHKNKLTPYMNRTLNGVISRTVVRGKTVYHNGKFNETPQGKATFRKN
ncbi:hypothetical protein CAPTEDRAFT_19397 [Capitella teleta]|uniref:allantoinase n=1 Tax=Capitella teleta TaxID=283909 RepID=R7VI57_CAPTE|nr:hypothetical protein CAPTEDRAFT_19397 [Capitella teleta]|eukprot:ELU15395.1 hypothetical protein CAPTEDRAFT_19397 [Capitella teleta]